MSSVVRMRYHYHITSNVGKTFLVREIVNKIKKQKNKNKDKLHKEGKDIARTHVYEWPAAF